tara:strand:+ start:2179 stop:2979 length:801 start_codon:yes stop_codon:yes gene_type:complete
MAKFNVDDYEMVKDRLPVFYDKYKDGRVTTEIHSETDNHVTIKACLFSCIDDQVKSSPLSTGYAREERGGHIDKYTENAETSAIGRALANLNLYGVQAEETGNRPSREEMTAVKQPEKSLADFAKEDLKLREVSSEAKPALPFEDNKPGSTQSFPPQKQIKADRSSGNMAPIEMPNNFNCPHGFCEVGADNDQRTFLQQTAPSAIRGGVAKVENWDCDIISCRKSNLENVRVDGGQWCNAQWKKENWFELAQAGENTDWDNGSHIA